MLIGGLRHQLRYSIGTQHLDGDCFYEWLILATQPLAVMY